MNRWSSQIPSRRIAAGLAACAILSAPAFASATTSAPDQPEAVEAVKDVQSALADLRADGEMTGKVIADTTDALPDSAFEPIELADVSIGIPVEGASRTLGNNVVFDGPRNTTVVAQMTAGGGARALVSLDSPAAPPSQSLQSYSLARSMTAKGSVFAIFASYVKLGFRGGHVRVSPAAAAWRVGSAEVPEPPQPEASAPAERAMAASAGGLRGILWTFHR